MIKITAKAHKPIPTILQTKGTIATNILIKRYNLGERNFTSEDFDNNIYRNSEVKEVLTFIQYSKCGFCESKITHIDYGDVEHFRPKAGWVQNKERLNKPGYYWLAYDWQNLIFSCKKCNQRHKRNLFPLFPKSTRALSHNDDISIEDPLFINPNQEDPEEFIEFNLEIPTSINKNKRGIVTIECLGLDRKPLNEQRRDKLKMVNTIYNLAKGYPDTNPELKAKARAVVQEYYDQSHLDSAEYSSMLKSFFKKNPIDF